MTKTTKTNIQANNHNNQTDKQTSTKKDKKTNKQQKQTDRQTDKQAQQTNCPKREACDRLASRGTNNASVCSERF